MLKDPVYLQLILLISFLILVGGPGTRVNSPPTRIKKCEIPGHPFTLFPILGQRISSGNSYINNPVLRFPLVSWDLWSSPSGDRNQRNSPISALGVTLDLTWISTRNPLKTLELFWAFTTGINVCPWRTWG